MLFHCRVILKEAEKSIALLFRDGCSEEGEPGRQCVVEKEREETRENGGDRRREARAALFYQGVMGFL